MSQPQQSSVSSQDAPSGTGESGAPGAAPGPRGLAATAWSAVAAVIATVMGLLPHLLHHVGLLAGVALVTGAAGNILFGVLGLVFSLPLLRRLYRRFGTWKAPAVALAVFATMFSLSAFVIGPTISDDAPGPSPVQSPGPDGHSGHHGG
jgi:hypothetical protein